VHRQCAYLLDNSTDVVGFENFTDNLIDKIVTNTISLLWPWFLLLGL
jgi:hypothetical protein